jgi:hypothetical protein
VWRERAYIAAREEVDVVSVEDVSGIKLRIGMMPPKPRPGQPSSKKSSSMLPPKKSRNGLPKVLVRTSTDIVECL